MSQKTTTSPTLKHRFFTNYQRMLTFAINLGYRDIDYSVEIDNSGYKVKYLV